MTGGRIVVNERLQGRMFRLSFTTIRSPVAAEGRRAFRPAALAFIDKLLMFFTPSCASRLKTSSLITELKGRHKLSN